MDESLLAAKMKEMAKEDMKRVKASGSFGDYSNFGKSRQFLQKQKMGGHKGRPNGYKVKIYERLEKGMSVDEIVAELNCTRNIVNRYKRMRIAEQDAAPSQAA